MMISTRGRYALRVMIDLAQNQREGYIPLEEIARRQDISEKYLESIIVLLSRGGLVLSLRGKGGGYKLSRLPEEYPVGEILLLTEKTLSPVACLEKNGGCSRSGHCLTLPLWEGLDKTISEYLMGYTLRDLLEEKCTGKER